MAKAKTVTTFEFEYDEALFEKYFLEAHGWETVEEYERMNEEKFPTCEEFLAGLTKEEIVDIYYDGEYYHYPKLIVKYEYVDSDFEKI